MHGLPGEGPVEEVSMSHMRQDMSKSRRVLKLTYGE